MFSLLAQTYQVRCNNRVTRCFVEPPLEEYNGEIILPDFVFEPGFDPLVDPTVATQELTLSADLAMFLTYLLRCVVFHLLGLALCWVCTLNFRRQYK